MINALTHTSDGLLRQIVTPVTIANVFNGKSIDSLGIWDTGATGSAITKSIAEKLQLLPLGQKMVNGIQGISEVNEYYIKVTLNNRQIELKVNVTECEELSRDRSIGMLIGMDFINLGDFVISNFEGKTIMTFRVPSQKRTDFVEDISKQNKLIKIHREWAKVGNQKCPCGSGKLWVNCHGKNENK